MVEKKRRKTVSVGPDESNAGAIEGMSMWQTNLPARDVRELNE